MTRATGVAAELSLLPTDRRYSRDGVWVRADFPGGRLVRVGLTAWVTRGRGAVASLWVRPIGIVVHAGQELVRLETDAGELSVRAPVAGVVVDVNSALTLNPGIVAEAPYGDGWLALVDATNLLPEARQLLEARAYLDLVTGPAGAR
jgi:glycine cleavage system H protein